jgi:hypothetical protein
MAGLPMEESLELGRDEEPERQLEDLLGGHPSLSPMVLGRRRRSPFEKGRRLQGR